MQEHYENDLIELLEAYDHNKEVYFQMDIYEVLDVMELEERQHQRTYG